MPLNERKIISIILEESKQVEERFQGYQTELIDVIGDILGLERQHKISRIRVQDKINDKCDALGTLLKNKRSQAGSDTGEIQ